jgi:LPXTG-motif cell wall-anchored protein
VKNIATTARVSGTRSLAGVLLVAVIGLIALVGFAGPASATSPYPPAPSCAVAGTSTGSGSTITGTGFLPNSAVSVSLGGSHTTVTSNAAGSFVTSLSAGSGQLVATGTGCVAHGSVAGPVAENPAPASNQSGGLPNTGADVLGVAAVASLMVLGGGFLLVQGRRRHS